jgi:hypothetical protein
MCWASQPSFCVERREKIVKAKMERLDQLISQENTKLERVAAAKLKQPEYELATHQLQVAGKILAEARVCRTAPL